MPYIQQTRRQEILRGDLPRTEGEMNFIISWEMRQRYIKAPNYQGIAALCKEFLESPENSPFIKTHMRSTLFSAVQWCTAAKLAFLEFYARLGRNCEDISIVKNGDIYDDLIAPMPSKNRPKIQPEILS